ncbi:MAG: 2-amino-4-hydroxy-6-hydroxymethyldihydropteridine diphosphokinase [Pseudomonadota bacterium]
MRQKAVTPAHVALGANLPSAVGTPLETLRSAADAVAALSSGPVSQSRCYATPAFPAGSGPDYVNAVVEIGWLGAPDALLADLHGIEARFGRSRRARWEARVIDLDLVTFGQAVAPDAETEAAWRTMPANQAARETPQTLVLPHPRLAERAFVLVPLAEIAPSWRHPVTGRRVLDMLDALAPEDRAGVRAL